MNNVCKFLIMDWQRGNIPFFELPPKEEGEAEEETPVEEE